MPAVGMPIFIAKDPVAQNTIFMRAASGRGAEASLMLFQYPDNLFFREPGSLHRPSPQSRNRLTSKCGHFRGARQMILLLRNIY